jgi:hypothetical protein
MSPRTVITAMLALFVGASVATLVVKELQKNGADADPTQAAPDEEAMPVLPHQVIAYYFHGEARCPTCIKIETYSHDAVQKGFADALKDGRLRWRMVNFDEKPNNHFVEDYQLTSASVVLVDLRDGREVAWKNLPEVWDLTHDKALFTQYVQKEVNSYLKSSTQ